MTGSSYHPAVHYDRVTEAWGLLLGDELHYGVFREGSESLPEATRNLTALMIDALQLTPEVEVLDVGCGTGTPACRMAEAGARVVGITTSTVGIEAARRRASASGLAEQARFEERDGMNNGFPDGSFDRVIALESSHLMRDRVALIRECARVLRPGGILALCDVIRRRPIPFEEVQQLREPLALLRDVFGDARMEPLEDYAAWMTDAGLEVTIQRDLTIETRPTFGRWLDNAERHYEQIVDTLGAKGFQDFVDSCDILAGFWDDGTLGYGLLAATKP